MNSEAVAQWILELSKSLDAYPEGIRGVTNARVDLHAAAKVLAAGDVEGALLRVILASDSLAAGISHAKHYWDLQREIRDVLDEAVKVYLDTNIISALVRDQLISSEFTALSLIIEQYQRGAIDLCTSVEVKREVCQIPNEYEHHRTAMLRLFSLIRLASVAANDPDIEAGLPAALDQNDRAHVAQAIAAGARYFLTADQGILRLQVQIANIDVLKPSKLAQRLRLI